MVARDCISRRPPQSGTWRVELSEPQVSKTQNACRASLLGGPWRRVIPSAPIADDGAWLATPSVYPSPNGWLHGYSTRRRKRSSTKAARSELNTWLHLEARRCLLAISRVWETAQQIGSASCREGVGEYGEISGGAGP